MREKNPTKILRKAILGMLPRNNLRHGYIEPRLYIYTGPTHPHTAQLPPGKVTPWHRVPRKRRGDFHHGLPTYADPHSLQESLPPPPSHPKIQWTTADPAELEKQLQQAMSLDEKNESS
jgi:hypothetical protein